MNAPVVRGACPSLSAPMQTGDGLLVRLRPLAGGIAPAALGRLAEAAGRFGNGILEITSRGNLQIRGLTPESAPRLAAAVDSLGTRVQSGVPVETGPLAGLDPDEIADPRPLAAAVRSRIAAAGLAGRLGPKVLVMIEGGGRLPMDDVPADVRLTARAEGGWLVSAGGTASKATVLGLVPEEQAADCVVALLEAIAARGVRARGRDLRADALEAIARFSTLPPSGLPAISPTRGEIALALAMGTSFATVEIGADRDEGVISPLVGEMAGRPEGGAKGRLPGTPVGVFNLTSAAFALGLGLAFGQMTAAALGALAEEAAARGARDIRFAPGRAFLVTGVAEEDLDRLKRAAVRLGFIADPADPRLAVAACAGLPACASGHVATKAIAAEIASSAADLLDGSLVLHVSGCAKRCAAPAGPALTLLGSEGGRCSLLAQEGVAIAHFDGGGAAASIRRLALLYRQRRRPGESAAGFLERQGAGGLAAALERQE